MKLFALVFLGSGLGGMLRYGLGRAVTAFTASGPLPGFPWGTLVVNISGSFVMGVLAALFMHGKMTAGLSDGLLQDIRLFLLTGILGGYTTFSAFSLDAVALWENGDTVHALAYVLASVVFSLAALACGLAVVRSLS